MEDDPLAVNLAQHVEAIRLCLENHLRVPALMLIYGGIDVMANLHQTRNDQANRHDFVFWAENYMDCASRLRVSGMDLYAARCGVLHAYTAESRLSRQRHAARIFYTWGKKTPEAPNAVLRGLGLPEKMVQLEELFQAFLDGVAAFCAVLDQNPLHGAAVQAKARKLFMNLSEFPGVAL